MDTTTGSILLFESNPDIGDLITHLVFIPFGYQVKVAGLEQLTKLGNEGESLFQPLIYPIDWLLAGKMGKLNEEPKQVMTFILMNLFRTIPLVTCRQLISRQVFPDEIDG